MKQRFSSFVLAAFAAVSVHAQDQGQGHAVPSAQGPRTDVPSILDPNPKAVLDKREDADAFVSAWMQAGLRLDKSRYLGNSSLYCVKNNGPYAQVAPGDKAIPSTCTLRKDQASYQLSGSEADKVIALLDKAQVSNRLTRNGKEKYEIGKLSCPSGYHYEDTMLVPDTKHPRSCSFENFRRDPKMIYLEDPDDL